MILYLHIPFCTSKCGYCAFNSSSHSFHLKAQYVQALCEDIEFELKNKNHTLSSIYIGGGTPNTLSSKDYERIFECIIRHAKLSKDYELTLECNPDLITKQWCLDLYALGANRLSVGVQSFFDEKLQFLQREHQGGRIKEVLEMANQAGFENLSIDLIYGTPMDTPQTLSQEIALAASLPLSHLSAYSLSIDQGSRFHQAPPALPLEDLGEIVCSELMKAGFVRYEVSNFYKTSPCLHNLAYWRGEEYIGCGAGAVGFEGGIRYTKTKSIALYIQHPFHRNCEVLLEEDRRLEELFLGLRCELGIKIGGLHPQKVQALLEENKAFIQADRLIARDFFLADEIALYLS